MARRKVARTTTKPRNCRTTKRKTCARTKKSKKESKLKKIGKFALGAGALAGAGALGYYAHKNRDKLAGMYSAGMNKLNDYYQTGMNKLGDMYNSAKTNYYDPAVEKIGDLYDIGKYEVQDLYQKGKDRAYSYGSRLKNATYRGAKQAADWVSGKYGEKYGNSVDTVANKIPHWDGTTALAIPEIRDTSITSNNLSAFKDNLKRFYYVEPQDLKTNLLNYRNEVQARDPFKISEVDPLLNDAMSYVNKAKRSMEAGETFFTDTYKRGLDKVLDALITKYNEIMR